MTKQEMLDAIYRKIDISPMKNEVIEWALKNRVYGDSEDPNIEYLKEAITEIWDYPLESLLHQSEHCITFIYKLTK